MPRPRLTLLLLAAFVAAISTFAAGRAGDATAAGPVPITAAPKLDWGFKASWANYAAEPQMEVGEGATMRRTTGEAATYHLEWEFEAGGYDEETRTTTLAYKGRVHWLKYPAAERGYTPPPGEPDAYLLDVTVKNPQITISAGASVLTAEVISREYGGKGTLQLIDFGRVPLENLEVLDVTPTVAGGTTTWTGIPATLTEAGGPAFAGFYRPGQVLDELSFSYTGPGGAPDFSEHFDEEGQAKLKLDRNVIYEESPTPKMRPALWIDEDDMIANWWRDIDEEEELQLQAFDLNRMEPVGEPLDIPWEEAPWGPDKVVAYDSNNDRILYHGWNEQGITRWAHYDAAAGKYEIGTIGDPRMAEASFLGQPGQGLGWNEELDLGYRVQWVEAADEWQLLTYREGQDGQWTRKVYPLPGIVAPGQDFGPAQRFEPLGTNSRGYATASDGSMIVLDNEGFNATREPDAAPTIPAAFRLTLDEATETVAVEALPLRVANDNAGGFGAVQTAANGRITLIQTIGTDIVQCAISADDQVHCDEPVAVTGNVEAGPYKAENFATDPDNGLTWYAGTTTRKVAAFGGGKFLGAEELRERNPKGGPIVIGPGHTVYVQTNDGSPAETGGSRTWGWAKLDLLGFTPTVTAQPRPQAVELGPGEDSKEVNFTAAATGEPSPGEQWQAKAPGAARFVDLSGETGQTLSVAARPGMDGTEYRALFTNAAGTVAGQAAKLSVDYSPRIGLDLTDVTVTEGRPAAFSVLADGNPAPETTWQRLVDGSWVSIGAGDDGFTVQGPSLTVTGTVAAQSGTKFRAVVANSVGTTYSRVATLTVRQRAQIPAGGIAVSHASLDWLGNEEIQGVPFFGGSNYFSAGFSAGKEAGYHATDGNAAIWQVSPTGSEALATYATRADHVAGGRQVARLYEGVGRLEPDGSADIRWDAAFSVNFYGGLVPFTIENPELKVAADGAGTLTATLVGCSSSMAESDRCAPLAPATEVVVASFTGATIEPSGPSTIEPRYRGVAVEVPTASGAQQQVRKGADWGSWPQSFVDFQLQTGLNSYWYSSGLNDDRKPPLPFTVNVEGSPVPGGPGPSGGGNVGSAGTGAGAAPPASTPKRKPKAARARIQFGGTARLDAKGRARIATLACPKGGVRWCEAIVPARLAARIGGKRHLLSVKAPRRIKAGHSAPVTVVLPKGARNALAGDRLKVRLRIVVRAGKKATSKVAVVTLVGKS